MKKLFLLSCLVLTALVTMAQTKRVAILETVDKEGKLSYSQKLLLRSNMARAVTNTTGYEAYDRSDVDVIMSEHEFQRTGYVSNDQIKKLGEMTGVSLIMVTEGVLPGDGKLFVTAKILNVETGRVEIIDNLSMGLSSDDIQEGCTVLAKRLFGTTASSNAVEKYNVERYGANEYVYMGNYMNGKEFELFLRNNCPKACHQYKLGKQLINAGWGVFAGGMAISSVGVILMSVHNSTSDPGGNLTAGMVTSLLGVGIILTTTIPLLCVGYKQRNNAYKVYNDQCASSAAAPITLNLTAGQNGIGLALNF